MTLPFTMRRPRPLAGRRTLLLGLAVASSVVVASPARAGDIAPPVMPTGSLVRFDDAVALGNGTAGRFTFGQVTQPSVKPTLTAQPQTLSNLAAPSAMARGHFGGGGKEYGVAVGRCAAPNATSICVTILRSPPRPTPDTITTPAWTEANVTSLNLGTAQTVAPQRIRLAAGNLDADANGVDELVVAWTQPAAEPMVLGGTMLLRAAVLRIDPDGAPGQRVSQIGSTYAPAAGALPTGSCSPTAWSGGGVGGTAPANTDAICANRLPFALTTAELRNDGKDEALLWWDSGAPTAGHTQTLEFLELRSNQLRLAGSAVSQTATDHYLSMALGVGRGLFDDAPGEATIVFAGSTSSSGGGVQSGGYRASIRRIGWNVGNRGVFEFLPGSDTPFTQTCNTNPGACRQGGEIDVAVGDMAPLAAGVAIPDGLPASSIIADAPNGTPEALPVPTLSAGGGLVGGRTYRWRYAWVKTGPRGGQLSKLSDYTTKTLSSTDDGSSATFSITDAVAPDPAANPAPADAVPAGYMVNVYRTRQNPSDNSPYYFAGQIKSGETSFVDTRSDASLGPAWSDASGAVLPDGRAEIAIVHSEPTGTSGAGTVVLSVVQRQPGGGWQYAGRSTWQGYGRSSIIPVSVDAGSISTNPSTNAGLKTTLQNPATLSLTDGAVIAFRTGTSSASSTALVAAGLPQQFTPFDCNNACSTTGNLRTSDVATVGAARAAAPPYTADSIMQDDVGMILPDLAGNSITLGSPEVHVITGATRPVVLLRAPPTHYDRVSGGFDNRPPWVKLDPSTCYPAIIANANCFLASSEFAWEASIASAQTSTAKVSERRTSSYNISASYEQEFGLDVQDIIKATLKVSVEASFGQEFINSSSQSSETQLDDSFTTVLADSLVLEETRYVFQEFPIYAAGSTTPITYFAVTTPQASNLTIESLTSAAINKPWLYPWMRDHLPGNILSYPQDSEMQALFSSGDAGIKQLAATKELQVSDASKQRKQSWKVSESSETNDSSSWKVGVDVGLELNADEEGTIIVPIKNEITIGVKGDYRFEQFADSTVSLDSSQTVSYEVGLVTRHDEYYLRPYFYVDKSGTLTLDWSVDIAQLPCTAQTKDDWNVFYSGPCDPRTGNRRKVPDFAFALPFRIWPMVEPIEGAEKQVPDDPSEATFSPGLGFESRNVVSAGTTQEDGSVACTLGGTGNTAPTCTRPAPGKDGTFVAEINNYSLDAATGTAGPTVRFYLGDRGNHQPRIPLADGTVRCPSVTPQVCFDSRTRSSANATWRPPLGFGGQKVTFVGVVDPGDTVREIIDWREPWDGRWEQTDDNSTPPISNNEAWRQVDIGGDVAAQVNLRVDPAEITVGPSGAGCADTCLRAVVRNPAFTDTTGTDYANNAGRVEVRFYKENPITAVSLSKALIGVATIPGIVSGGHATASIGGKAVPPGPVWVTVLPLDDWDGYLDDNLVEQRSPAPGTDGKPTVLGAPAPGSTIFCDPGAWTGNPSFAYQWRRDRALISSETGVAYEVLASDATRSIDCVVTASNPTGSVDAVADPVTIVGPPSGAPVNTDPPAVTGPQKVGQTLDCSLGTWDNAPAASTTFTRQWLVSGKVVSTKDAYTVTSADANDVITCEVVATTSKGSGRAHSAPVALAVAKPGAPALKGVAGDASGQLAITPPASDGGAPIDRYTITCTPDCGGSKQTSGIAYLLKPLRNGTTYTVTVTAHNAAGDGPASNAVRLKPVKPKASVTVTPSPRIIGAASTKRVKATCKLAVGPVRSCAVTIKAGARVVGKATLPGGKGNVPINAAGVKAAAAPGGVATTVTALVKGRSGKALKATAPLTLIRKQTTIVLVGDVLFASGSSTISPAGIAQLRKVVARLAGSKSVACVGHTDDVGSAEYNMQLGQNRANAVCRILSTAAKKTVATSKGETAPVASNGTPAGRAKNRRVEVTVTN